MNRFQPILDIAEICSRKGITNVTLSPGSRCAPLTLAFTRHPKMQCRIFADERSAGFIGLGVAQQTGTPCILLCTSGTAAYNFSPSVAEAFFSHTPLIVFTADRPAEWIGQQDGQTIFQQNLFGNHVKQSFTLPDYYDHPDTQWQINRIINDAINLALEEPQGPVHINAPFREPLYPSGDEKTVYSENIRVIGPVVSGYSITEEQKAIIREGLTKHHNILIVSGQNCYSGELVEVVEDCSNNHAFPILADIVGNLHPVEKMIRHSDLFLGQASDAVKKTLRPDLLITFGGPVLSKNLKIFLRKHTAVKHWHIQPHGVAADPFQSITNVFQTTPLEFFRYLNTLSSEESFENQKQRNYYKFWEIEERRFLRTMDGFFSAQEFGELELVKTIIHALPNDSHLHLANSMSVRYANFIGLEATRRNIKVYANRGTSGIDGSNSTAVGHALSSDKPNILITGDLAFFYDRNAFWHNYATQNLRVVVLNNHGGLIFGMIDGPAKLPEADEYFITRQKLTAQKLCEEFGFTYLPLDNKRKLKNLLRDFFEFDGQTKIMEFESDASLNKTIFASLKQQLKKSYEI
jgi:2-succinyl-5-enolpyruvyl-6-hydroxy-3-cyclohexene-1-carboxylate synthase